MPELAHDLDGYGVKLRIDGKDTGMVIDTTELRAKLERVGDGCAELIAAVRDLPPAVRPIVARQLADILPADLVTVGGES